MASWKTKWDYYNILKNRVNSNNLIDISKDSLESSKELLVENLLKDLNRKIDDYQTKYLIDQWNKTNYSPLYLKIAIEEVAEDMEEILSHFNKLNGQLLDKYYKEKVKKYTLELMDAHFPIK